MLEGKITRFLFRLDLSYVIVFSPDRFLINVELKHEAPACNRWRKKDSSRSLNVLADCSEQRLQPLKE